MSDPLNAFVPGGPVYLEGAATGPLSGLRFAAKDIFDVAGHVTGGGNPDWTATHPLATTMAPVVTALLAAGANLVGKTMTDELTRGILALLPIIRLMDPRFTMFAFGDAMKPEDAASSSFDWFNRDQKERCPKA